jgi:uncharacterized protein DUF6496
MGDVGIRFLPFPANLQAIVVQKNCNLFRRKWLGDWQRSIQMRKRWLRNESVSIPAAPAVTSKVRCDATNGGTAKSGRGGKGGKVKSRKQAIAIGLSKARKKGKKVPRKKS